MEKPPLSAPQEKIQGLPLRKTVPAKQGAVTRCGDGAPLGGKAPWHTTAISVCAATSLREMAHKGFCCPSCTKSSW